MESFSGRLTSPCPPPSCGNKMATWPPSGKEPKSLSIVTSRVRRAECLSSVSGGAYVSFLIGFSADLVPCLFEGRGRLNTSNGELTITGLTPKENGFYTLETKEMAGPKIHLIVICKWKKNLPQF